jgi:hypothetical protein
MNGENKKDLESNPGSSPSLWSRLRSALGHVGLFVTLMIYTAVGGMVSSDFTFFESLIFSVLSLQDVYEMNVYG